MNFLEELNNEISVVIKCKISKFIKEAENLNLGNKTMGSTIL